MGELSGHAAEIFSKQIVKVGLLVISPLLGGSKVYHRWDEPSFLRRILLLIACWYAFRYCAMSKKYKIEGGGKRKPIWLIELCIKL